MYQCRKDTVLKTGICSPRAQERNPVWKGMFRHWTTSLRWRSAAGFEVSLWCPWRQKNVPLAGFSGVCVLEKIRERAAPKQPPRNKHYQCKFAFTCNQSELLLLNRLTKPVIQPDSFVRDGGLGNACWGQGAKGRGTPSSFHSFALPPFLFHWPFITVILSPRGGHQF